MANVCCGGTITNKVWKIQKSNMSKVSESADVYGGIIQALVAEYAAGTLDITLD